LGYLIRLMSKEDLPQVSQIDREAFPTMWPPVNFASEFSNRLAHYIVACDDSQTIPLPAAKSPPRLGLARIFGFRHATKVDPTPAAHTLPVTPLVVGFLGFWMMVDESHIINIAVRKTNRGHGVGELLLIAGVQLSARLNANMVTLEVRTSNKTAQNLYSKYGFGQVGLRRGYYTDNHEDALIMSTENIHSTAFRDRFQRLKEAHFKKLDKLVYLIS
jgi:[ribosomal protein S18]-alanine N-acetyltransferase